MKQKINCSDCQHMNYKVYHARFREDRDGIRRLFPTAKVYYCKKTYTNIQRLKRFCKHHVSISQLSLKEVKEHMVKLSEMPQERGRVELKDLPQTVDLKATDERMVEASQGKSGGLIITYKLRDGREFPQKYTKVSGAELIKAMETLKLDDTEQLQNRWYTYRLSIMRIGLPRMIPQKLAKVQDNQ